MGEGAAAEEEEAVGEEAGTPLVEGGREGGALSTAPGKEGVFSSAESVQGAGAGVWWFSEEEEEEEEEDGREEGGWYPLRVRGS